LSSVAKGACDCESKIGEQKAMSGKEKLYVRGEGEASTSLPLVRDNAVDGADSFLFKMLLKP